MLAVKHQDIYIYIYIFYLNSLNITKYTSLVYIGEIFLYHDRERLKFDEDTCMFITAHTTRDGATINKWFITLNNLYFVYRLNIIPYLYISNMHKRLREAGLGRDACFSVWGYFCHFSCASSDCFTRGFYTIGQLFSN